MFVDEHSVEMELEGEEEEDLDDDETDKLLFGDSKVGEQNVNPQYSLRFELNVPIQMSILDFWLPGWNPDCTKNRFCNLNFWFFHSGQ